MRYLPPPYCHSRPKLKRRYTAHMRHLIILPGNSAKNAAWGELMRDHYAPYFDSASVHAYAHWATAGGTIDFAAEQAVLARQVAELPAGVTITIFAKSAGALLTFLAVDAGVVTPAFTTFFGIPFDLAAKQLFATTWQPVASFSLPAVAFHNVADPVASYDYTCAVLQAEAPLIPVVTTHETDHWYGDTATYDRTLAKWLQP